ncbi:type I restriction system specificity protein [Cohnella xylanilytica]|uniref:restriction endonuclease subunit S n=1 Tax=Cohnella xylanilytica TaxID=557555 RepID=UPI001B04D2D5|nr:restriction endonuclease subunit S [Cohnella xylanilytica]GIO15543.1 type I restriction system specificity protein [Cohnella xylanilytica]
MSFETWKTVALEDVLEAIIDYRGKTPKKTNSGVPLITAKIVKNGVIQQANEFISEKDYDSWMIRGFPKIGDVVLTTEAPLGEVAQLKNNKVALAQRIVTLRGKEKVLDNGFLKYFLMSSLGQSRLKEKESGTTVTGIKQSELRRVKIDIPNFETQKVISKILSSLDDKIELNNAINKNLEEMAQALFKRWFVDFEFPNENGEPYKSSGGEFEESELGLIPKGWKQGTISELGEVAGGATPSKKNEDFYTVRGIPWITPKDLSKTNNKYISRGEIDITQKGFSNSSVKLLPKGTVLFSSRAPIGYIAIAKNEVTTNQGFKSVIPFKHVGSEFVYYLLKSNVETIECRASGSTFKEISGTEMKRVPVLIPTENVLAKFNEIVEPIGRLTKKCEEENEDLTQIRDTLLPKLMSGEIRVPVEQDHNHPDLPKVAESSAIYQP